MKDAADNQTRERAIALYRQGLQISRICRQLGRSRAWFYKWLRRYESGDPRWSDEHSRAPRRVANKTPQELVDLVLHIRKDLEETQGSKCRAAHIQTRIAYLEWEPLPIRTINRILKQHQEVCWPEQSNRKRSSCRKQRKKTKSQTQQTPKQLSLF